MSEYATIYREVRLSYDPTDPVSPDQQTATGRFGYDDGAKMHWFDSAEEARIAARDDGFIDRRDIKKLFVYHWEA